LILKEFKFVFISYKNQKPFFVHFDSQAKICFEPIRKNDIFCEKNQGSLFSVMSLLKITKK